MLYYVQNAPEGGKDGPSYPNALRIQGERLTFGRMLASFPQAMKDLGPLHFRFKMTDKDHGFLWQDALSSEQELPVIDGAVHSRVLVLSKTFAERQFARMKLSLKPHIKNTASTPRPREQQQQQRKAQSSSSPSSSSSSSSQQRPPRYTEATAASEPKAPISHSAAPTRGPSPTPAAAPAPQPKVFDRDKLVAAREEEVKSRVAAAQDFKQELDDLKEREGEEFAAARDAHDANLTSWSTQNNEKRNVRNLLTSMQNVLWPGARWKAVGLGDVIEPKKVKLHYRKAMLVVHPDRCSGQSVEVRFIAKRIFEAVNEAYQEFLKKEGIDG